MFKMERVSINKSQCCSLGIKQKITTLDHSHLSKFSYQWITKTLICIKPKQNNTFVSVLADEKNNSHLCRCKLCFLSFYYVLIIECENVDLEFFCVF